jgi:hypothetical protein
MNKNVCISTLTKILEIYENSIKGYKEIMKNQKIKFRLPNFPEIISENLVKIYINKFENRFCKNADTGDLIVDDKKKIEIKCFSSQGPTTFGPNENWDEIYFLDCLTLLENNRIKIYKCTLSNSDPTWFNIKFNNKKNQTFQDKCKLGQRPRINFQKLFNLLNPQIQLVFDDNFKILLEEKKLQLEIGEIPNEEPIINKIPNFIHDKQSNELLHVKNKNQLLNIARQMKLKKYSKLNKDELIKIILKNEIKT